MSFNIGDAEMTVGELTLRGCYLGTCRNNVAIACASTTTELTARG